MDSLELVPVSSVKEEDFLAAKNDFPDEPHFNFALGWSHCSSFKEYAQMLDDIEEGKNMPEGYVQCSYRVAVVNGKVVGRASIRHTLNDFLSHEGGHVGYGVVSTERRKGYATMILKKSLVYYKEVVGLDRVLVTCYDDNIGSSTVIERNGGVLENTVESKHEEGVFLKRYWIDL